MSLIVLATLLDACHGSQQSRNLSDEGSDQYGSPQRDTGLVWALVDSDKIDDPRVLKPAQATPHGLPATIAGIWSMTASDHPLTRGPVALSLANAEWDEATLTAKFVVRAPNLYAFANNQRNSITNHQVVATGDPVFDDHLQSYWLTFSPDFRHADLTFMSLQDGIMQRDPVGGRYYMDLNPADDGRWLRVSYEGGSWQGDTYVGGNRLSDYDLVRIVKADGTRDAAFQAYLAAAPAQVAVAVPRDCDLGRGRLGADLLPPH